MSYSLVCKVCGRFVDIDDFDKASGCCDGCSANARK